MTYDEVTYPFLAPACRRDQCNHTVHPRYRTTRCRSGQCGCASKNLACGTTGVDQPLCGKCDKPLAAHGGWAQGHLYADPAEAGPALEGTGPVLPFPIGPVTPEVQPPAATATEAPMDKDTPTPDRYITRVDRPAEHREEESFMMHYGTCSEPSRLLRTVGRVAVDQGARTRIEHRYFGPMTVWVWEHRGDAEHYREDPPATAYRLDLGDQTDTINPNTKAAVERLHQEQT